MPIVGQFGSLAGLGSLILPGGAFESIATVTVGSGGASSIEFVDTPGGFDHLQIRFVGRTSTTTQDYPGLQINSGTGPARIHWLYGNGSITSAFADTLNYFGITSKSNDTANIFGVAIVDLLDYRSTSKNKVWRAQFGYDLNGSGQVGISSGLYTTTSAVSSLKLVNLYATNFAQHTTAALYGIRS